MPTLPPFATVKTFPLVLFKAKISPVPSWVEEARATELLPYMEKRLYARSLSVVIVVRSHSLYLVSVPPSET